MAGVFVTGTGTDVGKTFVTAALVRHLGSIGQVVDAFKPVVSGFDPDNVGGSDPDVLLAALGRPSTTNEIARISPWRFTAPLSPDLAAQKQGATIPFSDVVAFSRQAVSGPGTTFIEGVGGIMVPLDDMHTVLDWMSALSIPVLVVAGTYLGTISHTLTALGVLEARNLKIAGVIVSESPAPGASLADTAASIRRFAPSVPVVELSRVTFGTSPPRELMSEIAHLLP
jgi:dethiobiotin synthetase